MVVANFYPQTFSCFILLAITKSTVMNFLAVNTAHITDLRPISGHNQFFYSPQANSFHIFSGLKKKSTHTKKKSKKDTCGLQSLKYLLSGLL